jgi:hypothetical protein
VRVRLCGIGILPMRHGLEAHATVGSSAQIKPNPYESFLLGARNFLKPFVLTIDYPAEVFSIQRSS